VGTHPSATRNDVVNEIETICLIYSFFGREPKDEVHYWTETVIEAYIDCSFDVST
jgi:hypothetical protein